MSYEDFLSNKKQYAEKTGFEIAESELNENLFDFQRHIVAKALKHGKYAIFADTGLGKEQPHSEPVLTPSGFVNMGDLEVGDKVIAGDGSQTNITGVFEQGIKDVYKVTFKDGTSTRCGLDHLWNVITPNQKKRKQGFKTVELREIIKNYKQDTYDKRDGKVGSRYIYEVPVNGVVQFRQKTKTPLDPYLLGILLGDGGLSSVGVSLTSSKSHIVDAVSKLVPIGDKLNSKASDPIGFSIVNSDVSNQPSKTKVHLSGMGLHGLKSKEKFIPKDYLFSSEMSRTYLLKGLLDTDGHVVSDGMNEYSTSSEKLMEDISFLARSLGYVVRVVKRDSSYTKDGVKHEGFENWRVYIYSSKAKVRKSIVNIEKVGKEQSRCIMVDNKEHLYLTNDFIVTHNTLMQLSWAKAVNEKTGKPVLCLYPLAVTGQSIEEGEKFGIEVTKLAKGIDSIQISATNYEQLKNIDTSIYGGVVLDESSILKNYQGATKTKIIQAFTGTEYKLACTATPAPNDPIEFGNHSEFLDVKKSSQMVSEFFVNDVLSKGRNSKWRLKKHSVRDFYKWVSSWSTVVTSPADIGFDADAEKYELPPLDINYTMVDAPKQDNGKLFNDVAVSATQFHAELRKTIELRCDKAIKIAREHDGQVLLWITSNEEEAYIKKAMPEARIVSGSDKAEKKEEGLLGFGHGKYEYLVTKGKIAKFGLNFQNCQKQVFVSFDFSFEAMYQMIRRSWRFGQKKNVSIDLIYSDTMGNVKQEIQNKQKQFETGKALMTEMAQIVYHEEVEMGAELEHQTGDGWTLYNADCVEVARSMEENSIDYSFFSPPFADLYSYSGDPRDMSNNATYGQFFDNFGFIVEELLRITKEGRLCSMHCTNMATTLTRDGEIRVIDFRGDLIRFMSMHGWVYFGENTIWKDPRPIAQRSKAQNLLHATTKKDSTKNRSCFPDWILHFKKRGDNEVPVNNGGAGLDFAYWGKIAEPVWMDIQASEVLDTKKTKGDDEKHMTPTQLEPIRRCMDLYSSEGETVFSPFNGVGSEGTVALKKNRKYIGAELKTDYYNLALEELEKATMTSNTFMGL